MSAVNAGLEEVCRSLQARTDSLVDRQIAVLKAHPQYPELRELDLRLSARRNVRRAVLYATYGDVPSGPEYDELTGTVVHVIPDLSPDKVAAAFRAAMGVIRDAFIDEAERVELTTDVLALGLRRIWQLTDRYSDLLTQAHAGHLIRENPHRRDRSRYLERAFGGSLSRGEIELGAARLGLPADAAVHVFRVRLEGQPTQRLLRHVEAQAIGWPGEPLVTRVDGELAGLAATRPRSGVDDDLLIAVADPVLLADVQVGYLRASQLLLTAQRFGLRGVVGQGDLGLRSAILALPGPSEELFATYIRSVRSSTPMAADLLHTVETFLQCQRRFQRTAQILNMHVNSLRHRLERYREITGADLADTETVAEVWWALQYGRALEALDQT